MKRLAALVAGALFVIVTGSFGVAQAQYPPSSTTSTTQSGTSTTQPGPTTSQPGPTTSQPGPTTTQPGPGTTRPGPTTSRPNPPSTTPSTGPPSSNPGSPTTGPPTSGPSVTRPGPPGSGPSATRPGAPGRGPGGARGRGQAPPLPPGLPDFEGTVIRLGVDNGGIVFWDEEVTLIAEGYAGEVTYIIESTPIEIGRSAAEAGVAWQVVTIPEVETGTHTISAIGTAPDGTEHVLSSTVEVRSTMRSAPLAAIGAGRSSPGLNRRNAAILAFVSAAMIAGGTLLARRREPKLGE